MRVLLGGECGQRAAGSRASRSRHRARPLSFPLRPRQVAFGLPENGAAYVSFLRALLGLRALPRGGAVVAGGGGGALGLLGLVVATPPGFPRTRISAPLPAGWPSALASVAVRAYVVAGAAVDVECAVGGGALACDVFPSV